MKMLIMYSIWIKFREIPILKVAIFRHLEMSPFETGLHMRVRCSKQFRQYIFSFMSVRYIQFFIAKIYVRWGEFMGNWNVAIPQAPCACGVLKLVIMRIDSHIRFNAWTSICLLWKLRNLWRSRSPILMTRSRIVIQQDIHHRMHISLLEVFFSWHHPDNRRMSHRFNLHLESKPQFIVGGFRHGDLTETANMTEPSALKLEEW